MLPIHLPDFAIGSASRGPSREYCKLTLIEKGLLNSTIVTVSMTPSDKAVDANWGIEIIYDQGANDDFLSDQTAKCPLSVTLISLMTATRLNTFLA